MSGPRNTKLNMRLNKHKRIRERRIHHKYNVCTMDFASTGDLKKPRNGDNNQREHPFKCYICDEDFISQENLNGHRTTHAGEHPHKCSVCSKGFLWKYLLKTHLRIHTGERPHKHSICDKGFSRKGGLNNHVRIHTGERPYKCSICEKGFSYKGDLKKYVSTHTGEHWMSLSKGRRQRMCGRPILIFPPQFSTSNTPFQVLSHPDMSFDLLLD